MPDDASESAIVVRVRVPPAVERLRRRWDRAARMGVPAHVTILYPFVPPADLDAPARAALAGIAAAHDPFEVRFARVGRFPTAVYAAPDDPEPFLSLTESVVAAFPSYPPYSGAFDEVIPHLTVVESSDVDLDAVAVETESAMAFRNKVTRLEVLVLGSDARWSTRWRIRLGRERQPALGRATGIGASSRRPVRP